MTWALLAAWVWLAAPETYAGFCAYSWGRVYCHTAVAGQHAYEVPWRPGRIEWWGLDGRCYAGHREVRRQGGRWVMYGGAVREAC